MAPRIVGVSGTKLLVALGFAAQTSRATFKSVIYGVGDHIALGTAEDPCLRYNASDDTYQLWDLPLPKHPSTYTPPASLDRTSFVVISAPRSASTTLANVLDANGKVQMLREMFRVRTLPQLFNEKSNWTVEAREANRTAFMHDIYEAMHEEWAKPRARVRGFKVFQTHMTEDELRWLTSARHVLKIVLRRQDVLSQYVSELRAFDAGGNWNRPGASELVDERVPICVPAYERYLERQNAWYEWAINEAREHHPESWLFISTEQFVADPFVMSAVYAHLKIPDGIGGIYEYQPYSSDSLQDKVMNYEDVADLEFRVDNKW